MFSLKSIYFFFMALTCNSIFRSFSSSIFTHFSQFLNLSEVKPIYSGFKRLSKLCIRLSPHLSGHVTTTIRLCSLRPNVGLHFCFKCFIFMFYSSNSEAASVLQPAGLQLASLVKSHPGSYYEDIAASQTCHFINTYINECGYIYKYRY